MASWGGHVGAGCLFSGYYRDVVVFSIFRTVEPSPLSKTLVFLCTRNMPCSRTRVPGPTADRPSVLPVPWLGPLPPVLGHQKTSGQYPSQFLPSLSV